MHHAARSVLPMAQPRTIDPTGKQVGTALLNLRVTVQQRKQLQKLAKQRGTTQSALVRELLSELLEGAA